jgi:hypothetical protein
VNGVWPPCLFLVFSNARHGDDDALARWYMEVHGPDAFKNPAFSALHRYRAMGEYDARNLAVWECSFPSLEDARSQIVPRSARLRDKSRISDDLIVVWSSMNFRTGEPASTDPGPVDPVPAATVTLVEGGFFEEPAATTYRYGGVALYESPGAPASVARAWSDRGKEGIAPHGPYRNVFDHPETWPPTGQAAVDPWISHWRPIGSLRRDDG